MDAWGVPGCREHRQEIVGWLEESRDRYGWSGRLTAGLKSLTTGLVFRIRLSDPLGSLIDEAIRRAGEKESASRPSA